MRDAGRVAWRAPRFRQRWPGIWTRPRGRGLAAVIAGLSVLSLAAAGCGAATSRGVGTTPQSGGTVVWAEQPGSAPDYIFPLTPGEYFSVYNANDFQYLMYRPLYWFGKGTGWALNKSLSLASPPTYKGRTITIRMKPGYKWSNGEPVTAQDVVFWMNMVKAERGNWGGYIPGEFPDNVTGVRAVSPTVVTMRMTGRYSSYWFTYNELSQITPLPQAWDRTASGPSHCTTSPSDCVAVYNYLAGLALKTSTYATSPVWKVVDGPWRLTKFSNGGTVSLTYNSHYSGPVPRHHITGFTEIPFTSEDAEYNVLQAGNPKIDIGYIPTVDAPVPPAGAAVGQNPLAGYKLSAVYPWELSYFPYNFHNNTGQAPIFNQLYFRQAFQYLVDQEGVIAGPLHGYGKVTTGPVGNWPPSPWLSPFEKAGDPYPFNPVAAKTLLSRHGWQVKPGGLTTCQTPSLCGTGIKAGTPLKLTVLYATGLSWMESEVRDLVSNASEVGIQITAKGMGFNPLTQQVFGCIGKRVQASCNSWQIADWGSWTYAPDYLPTGDELFGTKSVANAGDYNNGHNDALINQTLRSNSRKVFYTWEDYLARQLPVVWQPTTPAQLTETVNNLHVNAWSSTLNITPEDWYYLK